MKKILVCEDEQVIREFVVINLKRAGYEAYEAENGEQALEIYEREGGDFDVAVLDIMMPGKYDGLAVCKELRKRSGTIGIILLTAKTQEMDKVSGLMMGADDYMTKPFAPEELTARIRALTRRQGEVLLEEMAFEDLVLELASSDLRCGAKRIRLSFKEFEVMKLLMLSQNAIVPKE